MPTLEHNGFVAMFRDNPRLAPHFLEILFHLELPRYSTVRVVESSLDQLIPVEFRADLVLELLSETGQLVLSIILEAQRDVDPRKLYSWPVYVVVVRAQKECPAIVLVIATDARVATWAAEKIDLGLGLGSVQPLVLGPSIVPEVTTEAEAKQETELAILSAVAHGNGPNGLAVVFAALAGLGQLDREHAAAYFKIVYNALREPMRRALELKIMEQPTEAEDDTAFSEFLERIADHRAQVRELKDKRAMLLRFLARAGIATGEEDRARIQACTDPATLDRWIENVIGARTVTDVLT
ncbi:MAG: hypothetical protein ABJE95_09125 [Byssovorax sp.]